MSEAFLQYASLQAFFLICNTFKQRQAGIGKKFRQMLINTLRLNFRHPKTIRILHPRYHLTIAGHICMLICIKQHLSNISSSVYENVKQH